MTKKHVYIRIRDKSDIDLSRISVYDLNNRYIDQKNNMYGLKYNRAERRIDLIKIVRAQDREAAGMQYKLSRGRAGTAGRGEGPLGSAGEELFDEDDGRPPESREAEEAEESAPSIDAQAITDRSLQLCTTHRDRLKGVIMNIRNSNVIPKDHRNDDVVLEDLIRSIEIDMLLGIDKIENHRRELIQYPRSVSYYHSRADTKTRKIIDALSTESERAMRFIFFTEMISVLKPHYRTADELMKKLKDLLSTVKIDEQKHTHFEKQAYADALTSIDSTLEEIENQLSDLEELERYVSEPNNF